VASIDMKTSGRHPLTDVTSTGRLNEGRRLAFETFRATLLDLLGRDGVTEVRFRNEWQQRLRDQPQLSTNGWYDPPPEGIAVFFGHDDADPPFAFTSLRPPSFWPAERTINWRRGLMYGYCSPVNLPDGMPADFGVTLYFGNDPSVRQHFKRALSTTRQLLRELTPKTSSRTLFRWSESLFREAGMRNNVESVTNSVPVDLGHSLPLIREPQLKNGRRLTEAGRDVVQRGRLFISESSDWPLSLAKRITIEPNLISVTNPRLPQVSPHYVAVIADDHVNICNECDNLLSEMDLL
jgi:hypothetical protein